MMARSPGLMTKHYSPRTRVILTEEYGLFDDLYEQVDTIKRVGAVLFAEKQVLSHRGRALRTLATRLREADASH